MTDHLNDLSALRVSIWLDDLNRPLIASGGLDGFLGCRHDGSRGEAELTEQRRGVSRRAVVVNADDAAGVPDDVAPTQWHCSLDTHAGPDVRGEDLVAIALVLIVEPLAARHRHDPGRNPLGLKGLACCNGDADLGASGDQDHCRTGVRGALGQDVGAVGGAFGRREGLAVQGRHGLSRQGQTRRAVGVLQDGAPRDRPAGLALSRQAMPTLDRETFASAEGTANGAYVLAEGSADSGPAVILIATGSEVSIAVAARETLESQGVSTRVVSMPCREWFDDQDQSYRDEVLPPNVRARVSIEAAVPLGWRDIVGDAGRIVSIDHFGASADAATLFREFGFTPAAVVSAAQESIQAAAGQSHLGATT